MTMQRQRIAVVNDDGVYLELMQDLLEDEGYKVTIWNREENPYLLLKRDRPQLIIIDIRLETPDAGWKVLEQVRLDPATTHIPVIVCSADTQFLRWKRRQLREMDCAVLEKPFRLTTLMQHVDALIGEASKHDAKA